MFVTGEPQQNESENNKENDPPEEAVEAVEETPIEPMIQDQDDSEQATNEQIDENRSSSTSETEQIGASALPENNSAESKETSEKIRNDETASKSVPINIDKPKESNLDVVRKAKQKFERKNIYNDFDFSQPNDSSLSMSESPRRFANQGLVYLSEIENVADIQDLSVKQAKDILAMNRVNFKGVVEKDELLKHVSRLWKQEKQAQEGIFHNSHYTNSQNFVQKFNFDNKTNIFTSFSPKIFLTIFLVKSKLSKAKKSKTATFSRVFHQILF